MKRKPSNQQSLAVSRTLEKVLRDALRRPAGSAVDAFEPRIRECTVLGVPDL